MSEDEMAEVRRLIAAYLAHNHSVAGDAGVHSTITSLWQLVRNEEAEIVRQILSTQADKFNIPEHLREPFIQYFLTDEVATPWTV